MQQRLLPFNVELLKLTPARLAGLGQVKSMDYFQNANGDLHEEGLFSISIFGQMGSEQRDKRFGYIDVKLEILHPVIYKQLLKLKSMYKGIIAGTQSAIWDEQKKDFIPADEINGQTGFGFFLKHWKKIEFVRNDSEIRSLRIRLIEKYRDRATTTKVLVMPAGLREIEVEDDGRIRSDDINGIYRRLISVAATVVPDEQDPYNPTLDLARFMLQERFNELYEYLENLLSDKKGFIQDRWASRAVFNSTRNVITAADLSTNFLGDSREFKYTDTMFGLYQLSRMLLPKVIFWLRSGYLSKIFSYGDNRALLVDPKTLKSDVVEITPKSFDRWTTIEGLEKVVASYGEISLRDKPIVVDGYYLALIYVGPDATFKIFNDIRELPSSLERKYVRPISLVELLYLSGYKEWNTFIAFVTRYPVTGVGSTYPSTTKVKTTVVGERRVELGDDWKPLGEDYYADEFPILPAKAYLDSQVVNSTRLAGLGGDYDGDTMSATAIYSDEALQEQKAYLTKKTAYVDPRGGLRASSAIPTIELVVLNMLGRV